MTNRLKFRVGSIGHACYFAVGAWFLNFCYDFSISSKMESLWKRQEVL